MIAEKHRPTKHMVERAYETNDDGAGIAFRELDKDGVKEVVWRKGLDKEEMVELCESLPLPYVAHFRIASIGGIRPQLTHPFPISKSVSLALTGRTKGHVLFHNGHWREWAENARHAAIASGTPVPSGKWSDSRAMAFLCAIYGNGFMELLPEQRGVAFGTNEIDCFVGPGWTKVQDVWCSNDHFNSTNHYYTGSSTYISKYCKVLTCREKKNLDNDGHCPKHPGGKELTAKDEKKVTSETSGGSHATIPFPQIPEGQCISLELAERLRKAHPLLISHNKIKKLRKSYEALELNPKGDKAHRTLLKLTRSITKSLKTGSIN